MKYALTATLALVLWLGLTRSPALAALTLCNDAPSKIHVAIGVLTMETQCPNAICERTDGWFNIEPGSCTTVIDGDLDTALMGTASYYYYADDDVNGHKWQGDRRFCIDPAQSFHFRTGNGDGCPGSVPMRFIETYEQPQFTLRLYLTASPPPDRSDAYATMNAFLDACAGDASDCLRFIRGVVDREADRFCVPDDHVVATIDALDWLRRNRYSETTTGDTIGDDYPLRAARSAMGNLWGTKGEKC